MLQQSERVSPVDLTPRRATGWSVEGLAGAAAFSVVTVVAARLWYDRAQSLWPTEDNTLEGLQFGSFLLVFGALLAWAWRGDVGLRLGRTFDAWREIAVAVVGVTVVTLAFVTLSGANAYSDADALFEIVLVPLGEEFVFRGVVLGVLLAYLAHRHAPAKATRLAVIYGAVAFGFAHASNALFGAGDFAVVQVIVATLMGLLFGALRVRTDSLIVPVVLHALINGINLLG